MDNRIANDMISSGMIPSGEKKKEDLSRTQYGSVPSPNKLMDAYKSMYEHHKKDADGNTIPHEGEELNEGKIPAGLQAYLDKKKGKKEDKKDMKEEVEKFDVVFYHFISEGYSEKEAYAKMANLTEEQLDEMLGAITRATKSLATRAAQYGANLGKPASQKINVVNPKPQTRKPFDPKPTPRKPFDAKKPEPKPGDSGFKANTASDVVTAAAATRRKRMEKEMEPRKGEVMADEYQYVNEIANLVPMIMKGAATVGKALKPVADAAKTVKKTVGKVANNPTVQNMVTQTAVGAAMNSGGPQKQRADKVSAGSYQAASADLFDIVKGQLLDEGLSEEEIKDIMLTLTPDEILNEISVGKMANYISAADKDVQKTAASIRKDGSVMGDDPRVKRMSNRGKGMAMAGDKIARKMTPSLMSLPRTEEYKNFDPKKPDPKQMAAQAKQEKNRQKFNDPMGVKNKNIGGQGLDPMDK